MVKGAKQLEVFLTKTVINKIHVELKKSMELGAEEIVAEMKSLVAVDDGDLRDSIGWTWGKAPRGTIKVGQVKSKKGDLSITIYAGGKGAYHAHFVERGTDPHENKGMFAGTEHPGTAPQPFFYVAYARKKRRVKSRNSRGS